MAGKLPRVYEPAPALQWSKDRAQEVGEYLEGFGEHLTDLDILRAAQPTSSPLHDFFDWDDSVAARKWRRSQARQILEHMVVRVRFEGRERVMPAFVNFKVSPTSGTGESSRPGRW